MKNNKLYKFIGVLTFGAVMLCGCDVAAPMPIDDPSSLPGNTISVSEEKNVPQAKTPSSSPSDEGSRNSDPVCLVCEAPGELTDGNEFVTIDYSNHKEGYIMVNYLGSCSKVKLQITGPNNVTYTYDLHNGYAAFPLTSEDGDYSLNVCENIVDSKYSIVFGTTLSLTGISEFGPYLYPNQYVYFEESNKTIAKGAELASGCSDDIEVVTNIYNYIISNITYDYDKADTVASGYISNIDDILDSQTGICLDYSAVMTSMLRSQSIPTRLEVGYVGKDMVYHAWISVYIEEIGWLNGVIQFNGSEWSLVDPTFGSTTNEKKLKSYIGDGTNYSVKYIY